MPWIVDSVFDFNVKPAGTPKGGITGVTVVPSAPIGGKSFEVQIANKNLGNVTSTFRNRVIDAATDTDIGTPSSQFDLIAGASKTIGMTFTDGLPAGDYILKAIIERLV